MQNSRRAAHVGRLLLVLLSPLAGGAAADVNLDGHPDVLTAHDTGVVGVLLGDGAGGLLPAQLVPAGNASTASSIAVADVSGDGLPDVILPRDGEDRFFVLLGDGTGGFALENPGYMMGSSPGPLSLGDFNGDHRPDVVASMYFATELAVHSGPDFTWKDLEHGLSSGSIGAPHLAGTGSLVPGVPVKLVLSGARPNAPAFLVIGLTELGLPFKGGTLVPFPGIVLPGPTNAQGTLILQGPMPPGTPPGVSRFLQFWIVDPAGPVGVSASNALSLTAP